MSNANTRAALAKRRSTPAAASTGDLRTLVERQKPEIARALTGTALDPERFTRIALTVIRQSRDLQRCRPESVLGALMTSAQLGLEPGPLGEAYLVPYKDECTFITGYQGMIKLAFQSGQIRHIDADMVREGDQFEYAKGADPKLLHIPALTDRGDPICYYAVASFVQGGHVAVVLSPEDVNRTRDRSPSARGKSSPWHSDYDAMAKKTCIRQLSKFLPMSTGLARALSVDGSVRTSISDTVDEVAGEWAPDITEGDADDAGADDPGVHHHRGHPGEHPNGPVELVAWSPHCALCEDDTPGQQHYYGHNAAAVPEESCTYCEREVAWIKSGKANDPDD